MTAFSAVINAYNTIHKTLRTQSQQETHQHSSTAEKQRDALNHFEIFMGKCAYTCIDVARWLVGRYQLVTQENCGQMTGWINIVL